MSPPVIWVSKDRAIVETSCAVHTALKLEGAEAINISYRASYGALSASMADGRWPIAGLRGIYVRATLQTTGPNQELKLDEKKLAGFCLSYRYLSYVLMASGRPVRRPAWRRPPGVGRGIASGGAEMAEASVRAGRSSVCRWPIPTYIDCTRPATC